MPEPPDDDGDQEPRSSERVVGRRRLISAAVALPAYAAAVGVVGGAAATTTAHAVGYLAVFSSLYALLSAFNAVAGYLRTRTLHQDTPDFAGGVLVTLGTVVFYTEVLAVDTVGSPTLLAAAAVTLSVGAVLVTKL